MSADKMGDHRTENVTQEERTKSDRDNKAAAEDWKKGMTREQLERVEQKTREIEEKTKH